MTSVPTPDVAPGPEARPDPDPKPEQEPQRAKWPIWTAPAAIAMGFGVGVFVSTIVGAIASVNGSSLAHPTPAVALVSDVLFDLAFVASAIFFSRVRGRPTPADFGFRRVRLRTAVGAVLAAGIGYYVVTAIYASILKLHGSDKLPKELGVGNSTAALVGAAV